MRRLVGTSLLVVALGGCGIPVTGDGGTDVTPSLDTTSTVATTSTTTPTSTSTTLAVATSTTVRDLEASVRATLEDLGVEPGEPMDQPANFATLPPPEDYVFVDIPHPRARIASRIEVDEEAVGVPAWNDTGVTITYVPGYTIWEYNGGFLEVAVDGDAVFSLNQDGTWTQVPDDSEYPPFGPFMEWSDVTSGYEGALSVGIDIVGYELVAGTETAHIRVDDIRDDLWADLWVDADAVVMRAVVDLDAEEEGAGNQAWLIWDVLTLDPQDVGPLPPTP